MKSSRRLSCVLLLVASMCACLPQNTLAQCACNADVNADGTVNVFDGICVLDCKQGDCGCCVNSCDINCDGVVDDADAHDDIISVDSAWLCAFQGGSAQICCPPTGACCNIASGACIDDTTAVECQSADLSWFEGVDCSAVICDPPPKGACCDTAYGQCANNVLGMNCIGFDDEWFEGQTCSLDVCPLPPVGACCNLGNGQCEDARFVAECSGDDMIWSDGVSCHEFTCAVPPQDPCPCNGDVNNDSAVNVLDGACILDCRDGDCGCCAVSCDINCDGIVDSADAHEDIINTESAWLCLFQGGAASDCCPPTGACCDDVLGECDDAVIEPDCQGLNHSWVEAITCADMICEPVPTGACCHTVTGTCVDGVFLADCQGAGDEWFEGETCAIEICPLPPSGACCNLGNGLCQNDLFQSSCTGVGLYWSEGIACGDVACVVPPQIPCPCTGDVNGDDIVNVTDAVCILDCQLGNCSCCQDSCDINCDGVVDSLDASVDLIKEDSTWLCLFQGGASEDCCSFENLMPPYSSAEQPALPADTNSQRPVFGKGKRP